MTTAALYTHDIAPLLHASLTLGPGSFKRYSQSLNGDGSVTYRVDHSSPVEISTVAFEKLNALMDRIAEENLEHPFFIIFNEDERAAVDVVVGPPGDSGYCPHTDAFAARAQAVLAQYQAESSCCLRLSRGHTHPVFFDQPSVGTGFYQKRQSNYFGAIPSNIYGSVPEWADRKSFALPSRVAVIDEIIKNDYIQSFVRTTSNPICILTGLDSRAAAQIPAASFTGY
jgi:hypothetical protein